MSMLLVEKIILARAVISEHITSVDMAYYPPEWLFGLQFYPLN